MNDESIRLEIKKILILCVVGILVLEIMRYIPDFPQWMNNMLFRKIYISLRMIDLFVCLYLIRKKIKKIEQRTKFEMMFWNKTKYLPHFVIILIGIILLVA